MSELDGLTKQGDGCASKVKTLGDQVERLVQQKRKEVMEIRHLLRSIFEKQDLLNRPLQYYKSKFESPLNVAAVIK